MNIFVLEIQSVISFWNEGKHLIKGQVLMLNISGIKLENFTVFKDVELKFDKGINMEQVKYIY